MSLLCAETPGVLIVVNSDYFTSHRKLEYGLHLVIQHSLLTNNLLIYFAYFLPSK